MAIVKVNIHTTPHQGRVNVKIAEENRKRLCRKNKIEKMTSPHTWLRMLLGLTTKFSKPHRNFHTKTCGMCIN